MRQVNRRVWLNVPYDPEYFPFRHAIEVVLWAFDMEPVLAGDVTRPDIRVDKLIDLIQRCSFGITEVLGKDKCVREVSYNMPFEHGLLWLLNHLQPHKSYKPILLCYHRYGPDMWFSNVRGTDALGHQNDPKLLIKKLRQWLVTDEVVQRAHRVKECGALEAGVLIDLWRATLPLRSGRDPAESKDVKQVVMEAKCELKERGVAVLSGQLIAPRRGRPKVPRGFQRRALFSTTVLGHKQCVPFVLYAGETRSRRAYRVRSVWANGRHYFELATKLRKQKARRLASYEKMHGSYGQDEKVTRLERIQFVKERQEFKLVCRRVRRWDVVVTNWSLDEPFRSGKSLRSTLKANEEIVQPSGLEGSKLGNTLGISVVIGNPSRKEVLLAFRSQSVNHPRPNEITVGASGEVRPSEWGKDGPDMLKAARRIAIEQAGLDASEIGAVRCNGIGRSAEDGIPELLFEVTTTARLAEVATRNTGRLQWENVERHAVSCHRRTPDILSWLLQPDRWCAQHFVAAALYLQRHHPEWCR